MRKERRRGALRPVESLLSQAMPPQFSDRAKLEKVSENWERVVGPLLGRQSSPLDLVDGELLVTSDTPLVASQLSMMGGNIARILDEQWRLEIKKVKVVVGRAPLKRATSFGTPRPPVVQVKEEEVETLKRRYIETLPEDAAESLARLQAFFNKRFNQDRNQNRSQGSQD